MTLGFIGWGTVAAHSITSEVVVIVISYYLLLYDLILIMLGLFY